MNNTLELVRAGAGSGKTTDLCHTVAEAVGKGLDPARILATTYTKKAAAELKGRIQAELLKDTKNRVEANRNAERLELAAIGTVHSVAHQLLCRYSIEMGLSPRLEVLTEDAGNRALSSLLGTIAPEEWAPLSALAEHLGIKDVNQRILDLLAAKRGNLINDAYFTKQLETSADRVCELLAPDGVVAEEGTSERLLELAGSALEDIDGLVNDTQGVTEKARQKLRQLKSRHLPLWGSFLEAAKITAGKKSGADKILDPLRNYAADVCRNPRLHADVREFSSRLGAMTIRLDVEFTRYKSERGLVDFTDLETLFLRLLNNESLTAQLVDDFDLVLVDEFQDTNPLQLAIFQRLKSFSPRNRWVGDPKQAIYGFRDTDPKLVDDIWKSSSDAQHTELPNNHRSQRGLVQLVGMLFAPVFGDSVKQTPQRSGLAKGVERWVFDTKNQTDDSMALACGIVKLTAEGIRFGDIAVLERSNRLLKSTAEALDALGIPCLLEHPGLLSTREGAIVLAGMRLVADRNDSLAAATIVHFLSNPVKDTPDWITERLQALFQEQTDDETNPSPSFDKPWKDDPRLTELEEMGQVLLPPKVVVQQVIEVLKLPTLVSKWGDPARRSANLDSLIRHSHEYEEAALENGQAATLGGLILYFEQLAGDARDLCYPPLGHDAVTLMTYHSAKGLEWPVIVLSGLNSSRDPHMWSPVVTGGGAENADPLEGRMLRSWVWPFGETDGPFGGLRTGSGLEDRALQSDEGQERASRESDENLRLLYVGCTRARDKLVFAHRVGKYDWLDQLPTVDSVLDVNLGEGEHVLAGMDTSFVIRLLKADMADQCRIEVKQKARWLAMEEKEASAVYTERFHSPSRVPALSESKVVSSEALTGSSIFPSGADETRYAAIGDAVHAYLAALPSMISKGNAEIEVVAARCLSAFSVTGILSPAEVVASGDRFIKWVEQRYPGARWHTEVASIGHRSGGGFWHGTMDLLLQLTDGSVVLIDHKSAPIRRNQCEQKALKFTGQVAAYREVLASAGEQVAAAWIHFPMAGLMVKMT